MIVIDFELLLAIYLGIWIVVMFLFFCNERYPAEHESFSARKKIIWHCATCMYTYILSRESSLSRCPICGSLNKKA